MTRSAVFVACVSLSCLSASSDVQADPVTITGGALVFLTGEQTQAGSISLTGTRGFSLQGGVDSGESSVGGLGFGFPPGSTVSIRAGLLGSALIPTSVTLDGQTYLDVNHLFSPVDVALDLSGTIDLPALQASVVATAPFTVDGIFVHHFEDGSREVVPIRGSGTVSMSLVENNGGGWDSNGLRYDFTQPTPEPATLTLMIGGLVAAASRARKRRNR